MLVRMLKTTTGCNDGIRAKVYEEGQDYELSESLSRSFLGQGVAMPVDCESNTSKVEVEAKVDVQPDAVSDEAKEEKSMVDSPENKAVNEAPENKSKGSKKAK